MGKSCLDLTGKVAVVFGASSGLGKAIALGPGKADLLTLISETGSINSAAKRMKMSYMRAWLLVKVMNDCFREPLVRTVRGGAEKGEPS